MAKKRARKSDAAVPIQEDSEWRARSDLDTMERAHEIQSDGRRMGAVKDHIRKKHELHKRFLRLKDRAL
jgi:hypothetical protein